MDALNTYLKIEAVKLGACSKPIDNWKESLTADELFEKYKKNLHFSLKTEFPSVEWIKSHFDEETRERNDIYIDYEGEIDIDGKFCIVMGKSDVVINLKGYDVGTVYVRHDSKAVISVCDHSIGFVRVCDNADVKVHQEGESKAKVRRYGDESRLETEGNVVVIQETSYKEE